MTKLLAGLAGALCLGLFASVSQAAPLGGADASASAAPSAIIQVHGLHSSCKLDKKGWHRSYLWGRKWCVPHHPHHGGMKKKYWKKKNKWN